MEISLNLYSIYDRNAEMKNSKILEVISFAG